MPVAISGTPTLIDGPSFAGLTIRVPLSEEPTKVWLDLLTLEDLPGKGYRLCGAAVDFHLDHNSHDVHEAMRKLSQAIAKAGEAYLRSGNQLEAGARRAEERWANTVQKISGQLETWWKAQNQPQDGEAQPSNASLATQGLSSPAA